MSAELQKSAVDVLGMSVKGASGVTVGAGMTTWFNPSNVGLLVTVLSFIIYALLAWEKHRINKLQIKELERHEVKDETD